MTYGQNRRSLPPYPVPPHLEGTQACYGVDTDDFFPGKGRDADKQTADAKSTCRSCPFVQDCLAYALARPDLYGIWGATTHQERAALRRRGRRTA